MFEYLNALEDGDMEVNTRYDQTTAFYNLIMDAAETAKESHFCKIRVVLLDEGVYDFYSGYPDRANGSGMPIGMPVKGAAHIRIQGQGHDKTLLRLHGRMQFFSFWACLDITISDLTVEYADEMLFAPCTNPHPVPFHPVGVPMRFDDASMLLDACRRVKLEHVRFWGENLKLVLLHCEDITLSDVAGDISILLCGCSGVFYGLDLACYTKAQAEKDCGLFDAADLSRIEDAVLCEQGVKRPDKDVTKKETHTIYALEDYRS